VSSLKLHLITISISFFFFSTIAIAQTPAVAPVANFSADKVSGCSPLTVKFTDLSTNAPTTWTWDFGNGQLQSAQNPTVNFSTPGTYTVKLIVRNAAGIDEEEKINYITVFPSPTASFTANITTACVPATIQFTDKSTITSRWRYNYILELEFWRWWYFKFAKPFSPIYSCGILYRFIIDHK
jgi:PKD repeat protein